MKSKKERCIHCDKILRMGDTVTISGTIDSDTPRNDDGTLQRSREIDYKKVCVNPRCPGRIADADKTIVDET